MRARVRGWLPPRPYGWILAGLLLVALGLRLWNIKYGLPWVYNRDEEGHFVPVAVRFFGGFVFGLYGDTWKTTSDCLRSSS